MTRTATRSLRLALVAAFALTGCAGTLTSKYSYSAESHKLNIPVKDENCYDASVLLNADAARTKDIASKVVTALDSTITQTTDTSILAQRNRHIGVLVGSGGEELAVNWKAVEPTKTFVTAATKTGFVGGAGQKAWSCKIIEDMVQMATK